MMDHIKQLKYWKKQINPICKTTFRKKGNKFIESSYIVGYHNGTDTSYRIEFQDEKTVQSVSRYFPKGYYFTIESEGHHRLGCRVAAQDSETAFETFKFILNEIIDSKKRINRMCNNFPKLTTKDDRKRKLNEII